MKEGIRLDNFLIYAEELRLERAKMVSIVVVREEAAAASVVVMRRQEVEDMINTREERKSNFGVWEDEESVKGKHSEVKGRGKAILDVIKKV